MMSDTLPPRVLRARMQLMLAHPYLAAALARLPIVNGADFGWCRTMATDGYYIYVNFSSRDIYRFCLQAIESIGLTREDWVVETA